MDTIDQKAIQREILLGFIKIHILHHAVEGPVVGQWMLQELRSHGYDISPGTLYPILHRMENLGWLKSQRDLGGGPKAKRTFHATSKGKKVLQKVMGQLKELTGETISNLMPDAKNAPGH